LSTGDAFVFSWSSLTPFAISGSAHDTVTKALTLVESSIAVLIVLIALSRFMSIAPEPTEKDKGSDYQAMVNELWAAPAAVDDTAKRSALENVKVNAVKSAAHGKLNRAELKTIVGLADELLKKVPST
jgi:hypothetical protein